MKKDFQPEIVDNNPPGGYLHLAYGITEDRRLELAEYMDNLDKPIPGIAIISIHGRVEEIAEFCDTKEEFAWALVTDLMYLAKNRKYQFL